MHRLNVVSVEMPPLRERKDDILALGMFFCRKFAGKLKKKIDGVEAEAQKNAPAQYAGPETSVSSKIRSNAQS